MKYPKIKALVPATEQFDESAVGEGVWLSTAHIDSIEKNAADSETAIAAKDAEVSEKVKAVATLTESLAKADAKIKTLEAASATADTEATASAARIKELEAEVVALGKNPSGTGTSLITGKDETPGEKPSEKIGLNSPEHPLNKYAASRLPKKKA